MCIVNVECSYCRFIYGQSVRYVIESRVWVFYSIIYGYIDMYC